MAALAPSIPRFLLPRAYHLLRPQARPLLPNTLLRHASSQPKTNSRHPKSLSEQLRRRQAAAPVIPQPDKYRPPSHGNATPRSESGQRSYGPALTAEDRERMRKKKYPNMMSPEGTFSHWFLNNRGIHAWFMMGILLTLAVAAWYMELMHKTIYAELFPTKREFLRHPMQSSSRFIEVYKMHVMHTSQLTAERRLKKQEDVEKRKQFRLARVREAEERGEEYQDDPRYYVDETGVRRRRVKKWLGIWE
ncbi:hypothetical protein BDV95DRAFT_678170 [Massariosphaeria phaeospora]|uniref:Uncharacterized protein n=1 Tax=Massariosphaeria phaeospora TaxID=100035 RepID=A0A7C8I3K1_9PLEO|nr:hypothetical protein BDV95DRAFT_678170 [Massariosphaeria phaeospora]